LRSALDSLALWNANGLLGLPKMQGLFCMSMAPIPKSEASVTTMNGASKSGVARTGAWVITVLSH
jgi:hypothetical protein